MAGKTWTLVPIEAAQVEVEVLGSGEPVVVVQTALTADELRPLAQQIAGRGGYRVIHYHRRGYARSSPAVAGATIADDTADCRAVMEQLDAVPAHVVGASFSAAIVLDLASSALEQVHTVTVMEPPPVNVPSAAQFRAANIRLIEIAAKQGPVVALEQFMTTLVGSNWRQQSERDLPGSVAAMERDAGTFFATDLPALLSWSFTGGDAHRIRCPVLSLGGSQSGPWFAESRAQLQRWLPQLEDITVTGAGHLLASTHPAEVAKLVTDFLSRHPTRATPA